MAFLHPEQEYSVSELAAHAQSSVRAVSQEVARLEASGLLRSRKIGNVRLVRAETDGPLARPLTDLLAVAYGPRPVLTDHLSAVEGIEHAFIYGSWAARYSGEAGPVPADVDVLVVGEADLDALYEAARSAEKVLGRPVNARQVRPQVWGRKPADPFLASIRSRPLIEIDLRGEARDEMGEGASPDRRVDRSQ